MAESKKINWHMDTPLAGLIFLITALCVACTEDVRVPDQSGEINAKAAALENSFTTPVFTFMPHNGNGVSLFGIKNCHVYKASKTEGEVNDWKPLFKPAPYALPKMCIIERMEMQGEYLHIEIGTQAMGAGGCCTTYAAYRTLDGDVWDIRPATSITTWQPIETND